MLLVFPNKDEPVLVEVLPNNPPLVPPVLPNRPPEAVVAVGVPNKPPVAEIVSFHKSSFMILYNFLLSRLDFTLVITT